VIPPPGSARLQAGRYVLCCDTRSQKQTGEAVSGLYRQLTGCVRVQRQEELAVGKPGGQLVRSVNREGGLADPSHPADRVNTHDPATISRSVSRLQQPPKLGLATYEIHDVSWQCPDGCRG